MSGITLNLNFHEPNYDEGQQKSRGNRKHRGFVKRRRFLEQNGLLKKNQNANNCQKGACRKKPWHGKNKKKKDSQTCALYPKSSTSQAELSTNPSSSLHNRRENSVSGTTKESTKPSSSESQRQSSTVCRVALLPKKKQNANNCQKGACRKKPWHGKNKKKKDSQTCALYPKSSTSQAELSTNPSSSLHNRRENSVSGAIKEFTKPSSSESQRQSSTVCRVATSPGNPLKYIAIDCEMVGTGPKGQRSELARCSIVSYDGNVIYDKFVKPVNPVTDLRTRWSGVRWQDLRMATPFRQAQREILKILSGKVVVGHAIHNDLRVLHYSHPACLIRDTSRIPILNQKAGLPEKQTASLKKLTKILFNKDIQMEKKGHSSVEDAKATMELYKVVQVEWERTLASKPGS